MRYLASLPAVVLNVRHLIRLYSPLICLNPTRCLTARTPACFNEALYGMDSTLAIPLTSIPWIYFWGHLEVPGVFVVRGRRLVKVSFSSYSLI